MNLADLTSVLIVLLSTIVSTAASFSSGAPWWLAILMSALGLILGIVLAFISSKLAYKFLGNKSKGFSEIAYFVGYIILPAVSLSIAVFISIFIPTTIAGKLGYFSNSNKIQTEQGAAANP